MVGTVILAPRPASETVTGTWIWMSSPSRWKNGCGSTRTVIYRSPAGPPALPALPLPATRKREPDCAPGGMRTSTVSDLEIRPSPPQVGHTLRSLPLPSHRGHVRLNFIAPAIWVTLPVPSHSGQTVEEPPEDPDPPQVSQTSCRDTLSRTCVPRIDSQKSMFRPYSRSAPFSGPPPVSARGAGQNLREHCANPHPPRPRAP